MQKRADAMDMEKSASRFKIFDTARNFGCIFFAYMQFGILHLNRRKKKVRCNMTYLHHVTTEENAKSILKNGLIPKIGKRSQLIGETKKIRIPLRKKRYVIVRKL